MLDDRFTLTEKIVLLKTALLDIEKIIAENPLDSAIENPIFKIIDEILNYPSEDDRQKLYQIRQRIKRNRRG